ncbi:MAG: hypothetical protein QOC97_1330, partial [Chloroflexota bacterium]|nr:hypothetical protein [Chloroflexota bacterium]
DRLAHSVPCSEVSHDDRFYHRWPFHLVHGRDDSSLIVHAQRGRIRRFAPDFMQGRLNRKSGELLHVKQTTGSPPRITMGCILLTPPDSWPHAGSPGANRASQRHPNRSRRSAAGTRPQTSPTSVAGSGNLDTFHVKRNRRCARTGHGRRDERTPVVRCRDRASVGYCVTRSPPFDRTPEGPCGRARP